MTFALILASFLTFGNIELTEIESTIDRLHEPKEPTIKAIAEPLYENVIYPMLSLPQGEEVLAKSLGTLKALKIGAVHCDPSIQKALQEIEKAFFDYIIDKSYDNAEKVINLSLTLIHEPMQAEDITILQALDILQGIQNQLTQTCLDKTLAWEIMGEIEVLSYFLDEIEDNEKNIFDTEKSSLLDDLSARFEELEETYKALMKASASYLVREKKEEILPLLEDLKAVLNKIGSYTL